MSTAEKVRLFVSRSLHNRLMICYSLCAVAQSYVREGNIVRASETLRTARGLIDEAELLILSPDGLTATERREGEELIGELKAKADRIETGIARRLSGR